MKQAITQSEQKFYDGLAPSREGVEPCACVPLNKNSLDVATRNILFNEATEAPFSHPLNKETRLGVYVCAGCNTPLFGSEAKFDSGTGWPSFYAPLVPNRIAYMIDFHTGYPRTEINCGCCQGHLGHVFSDGPKPTGLRYCLNGGALKFIEDHF